jgi:hypothetical protein
VIPALVSVSLSYMVANSNRFVGKSSLINSLLNVQRLAKAVRLWVRDFYATF